MPKKPQQKSQGDKELQKKYFHFQILRQHLSTLVEEKNALNEKVIELATTIQALQKLSDVKKGEEIWSSLGSGTFVRSDIKDIDNILVAVGAGVVVRETREKSAEILSARLEELKKIDAELVGEINRASEQAQRLEKELEHVVENR